MPLSQRSTDILKIQKIAEKSLESHVSDVGRLALIDFPDYNNIGDAAIYCGQLDFLKRYSIIPSYQASIHNFSNDGMAKSIGEGPILMQGGGNFGTLWPEIQRFREEVITLNKGRIIVQFPQTLYYDSQREIDRTARLIEKHGSYFLFVRDEKSYELATKNFQCPVSLCPDMAFFMGRLERKTPDHDFLIHLRNDKEAIGEYDTSFALNQHDAIRLDWPSEDLEFFKSTYRRSTITTLGAGLASGRQGVRRDRYRALARRRVLRGLKILSRGKSVVTNRLHGHILSYLMDIPHCVIDNSYGKTSSFMDAWGTGGGNVHRADTVEEAIEMLS